MSEKHAEARDELTWTAEAARPELILALERNGPGPSVAAGASLSTALSVMRTRADTHAMIEIALLAFEGAIRRPLEAYLRALPADRTLRMDCPIAAVITNHFVVRGVQYDDGLNKGVLARVVESWKRFFRHK